MKKARPHWPSYARALKREAKERIRRSERDLAPLVGKARGIEDAYYRAQALAWIARAMMGAGLGGREVFSEAVGSAIGVEPDWRRAEVLVQLGFEMSKAGVKDFGELLNAIGAIGSLEHRQNALQAVQRRIGRAGIVFPEIPARAGPQEKKKPREEVLPRERGRKRLTLGLFNTYAGKTPQDAHVRAIARAAPLCCAFDLNLCLFGFPVRDALEAVSKVERETRVGDGGRYLKRLFEEGRFFARGAPEAPVLDILGELVATTSSPEPTKRAELEKMEMDKGPLCFLMGLGNQGLPKGVLRLCRQHLELTEKDIPLETCTAMGVLAARLGRLR